MLTPSAYDGLITTLVYGKESLEYEEVVGALRSNEQAKKIYNGVFTSEAFAVHERRGRLGKRDKSKGRSEKVLKCYRYHKTEHCKKDCPLWKKRGKERGSICTVIESEGTDDLLVVSEEPAGSKGFEMSSERSLECNVPNDEALQGLHVLVVDDNDAARYPIINPQFNLKCRESEDNDPSAISPQAHSFTAKRTRKIESRYHREEWKQFNFTPHCPASH